MIARVARIAGNTMAWVDCMRLRRRADKVRGLGWLNLLVSVIGSITALDSAVLAIAALWAASVMAITYAIAWMIDKRADRVVTR
jgi:hypothetical protein